MKHFLYLDHDLVDSIIAQENKGLITGLTENNERKNEDVISKSIQTSVNPELGAGLASLLTGKIIASIDGTETTSNEMMASDSKVVTKILHDAAFDYAYSAISSNIIKDSPSSDAYGEYILIKKVFTIVDFIELETLLGEDGLIDYKKHLDESSMEKIVSDKVTELSATLTRDKLKSANSKLRAEMNKLIKENNKQYDEITQVIKLLKKLIPEERMLVSNDGYMIPMDEKYFRTNVKNMGIRFGGELTCVGLITNIIGEDCKLNEDDIFSTLQDSINSALISILPTKEKNLYVIQPIAIYYE